jgi:hypothetical protein
MSPARCLSENITTDQVLAENQNRYNIVPQEMSFMKKLAALRMYEVKGIQAKKKLT